MAGQIFNTWESDLIAKSEKAAESKRPYVWRSAVIPGWGQFYNQRKVKGAAFFFTFFGTAGLLVTNYNKYRAVERNYLYGSQSVLLYPADPALVGIGWANAMSLRSQYSEHANQVKSISIGLLAIYAFNLMDAYFFSSKPSTGWIDQKDSGLFLYAYIQPTTTNQSYSYEKVITASYTWRF